MRDGRVDREIEVFLEGVPKKLPDISGKEIKRDTFKMTDIDPKVFASPTWDQLTREKADEVFLPVIRYQIDRALETMPEIYRDAYLRQGIYPGMIKSVADFNKVPVLMKDPGSGQGGLRQKYNQHGASILRPSDLKNSVTAYFSGGTKGARTPTWMTEWDLEAEAFASTRGLLGAGVRPEPVVVDTYNSSHKGGEVIKRAFWKLGAQFIQAKTDDKAAAILDIIKRFREEGKQLIFDGVQTPISADDAQQKGSGRQFFDLVYGEEGDPSLVEEMIDHVCIGGFPIIPELESYANSFKKPVTSMFGATEVMPAFYGSWDDPDEPLGKKCTFNNLHMMYGPHLVELLKFDDGSWVPCEPGERGVFAFTTVFREGTIYLRYILGDEGTLLHPEGDCIGSCSQTPIVKDVKRIDKGGLDELVNTGCAAL